MCDSGVQRFDVINSSASIAMPAVIKGVDEVGNHQAWETIWKQLLIPNPSKEGQKDNEADTPGKKEKKN